MRVWLVGRLVLCSSPNATWDLLSRNIGATAVFWIFVDQFIVVFGSNWLQKNFERKSSWLVERKDHFNCKYKVTFQSDGCAEPTWAVTCFYSFWFRPLSRQHPAFEMYVRGVLFVLCVYSFCLWVSLECIRRSEGISAKNYHLRNLDN